MHTVLAWFNCFLCTGAGETSLQYVILLVSQRLSGCLSVLSQLPPAMLRLQFLQDHYKHSGIAWRCPSASDTRRCRHCGHHQTSRLSPDAIRKIRSEKFWEVAPVAQQGSCLLQSEVHRSCCHSNCYGQLTRRPLFLVLSATLTIICDILSFTTLRQLPTSKC